MLDIGVVVKNSNFYSRKDLRLARFLEVNGIDTVLDVGAHQGDYASELLASGFEGHIYSFEAQPDLHAGLSERAAASGKAWTIAPRCAVSDSEGTAQFHVTAGPSSSSLLPPSETATEMPDIFTVQEVIDVRTRTLDELCDTLGITSERVFLKLDIQGGEEQALAGAKAMIPRIAGMVVEMPLREYYENQPLLRVLDARIAEQGFDLWDIEPAWRHPRTGRLDYVDAVYFRPGPGKD